MNQIISILWNQSDIWRCFRKIVIFPLFSDSVVLSLMVYLKFIFFFIWWTSQFFHVFSLAGPMSRLSAIKLIILRWSWSCFYRKVPLIFSYYFPSLKYKSCVCHQLLVLTVQLFSWLDAEIIKPQPSALQIQT